MSALGQKRLLLQELSLCELGSFLKPLFKRPIGRHCTPPIRTIVRNIFNQILIFIISPCFLTKSSIKLFFFVPSRILSSTDYISQLKRKRKQTRYNLSFCRVAITQINTSGIMSSTEQMRESHALGVFIYKTNVNRLIGSVTVKTGITTAERSCLKCKRNAFDITVASRLAFIPYQMTIDDI